MVSAPVRAPDRRLPRFLCRGGADRLRPRLVAASSCRQNILRALDREIQTSSVQSAPRGCVEVPTTPTGGRVKKNRGRDAHVEAFGEAPHRYGHSGPTRGGQLDTDPVPLAAEHQTKAGLSRELVRQELSVRVSRHERHVGRSCPPDHRLRRPVARHVHPLARPARDRRGDGKGDSGPFDHMKLLDAESLARAQHGRPVVRVVRAIEDDSDRGQASADHLAESRSPQLGHHRLEQPYHSVGVVRLCAGNPSVDGIVHVRRRDDPDGGAPHGSDINRSQRERFACVPGRPAWHRHDMTTNHIRPPRPLARDGNHRLPGPEWGLRAARALCVVLALVGALPGLTALVVRSSWARTWATRETERILRERGIVATYSPTLRIWPLAISLDDIRVDSNDGGPPTLECKRVLIRPGLFALLAGKLAIDEVDADAPRIRAVVRDGRLTSLTLPPAGPSDGPMRAPFNTFSLTDASFDLDIDGTRIVAQSLDLDATAQNDRSRGASFEIAVRSGEGSVHRTRTLPGGATAIDDDAVCSLEGRMRIEADAVLVRRLDALAFVDLDPAAGPAPPCSSATADKRRVELSLGHVHVERPRGAGSWPRVDGHVRVRAPVALAERFGDLPDLDGWIAIDVDLRYAEDTTLPDASGSIEAHDLRLAQYAFAQELHSDLTIRRNVVRLPTTTIHLANGTVTLSDTVIDPLGPGARLEHTRLDVAGVDFTALLRALGVHEHSWVAWDIREIRAPLLSGTLIPLRIDGDFTAKTGPFGVYDRPAEDRTRERLFGFSEVEIAAHLALRPDAMKFVDVHAILPRSRIDGGLVALGFSGDLRVDVPHLHANLDDISPVGPVPMHGTLDASAHVGGTFHHPEPEGDITAAVGLVVADVEFGDVSAGHVKVDVDGPRIAMSAIRAKRRESSYEVPTARIGFGGTQGFVVDADGASEAFGLRDLLSMFALDADPRFDGLDATMGLHTSVHIAVGGPEDACGGGFIALSAKGHLKKVEFYGEHFAQGDADVTLHWYDRQRGLAGADLDVRSFVLDKVRPPTGTRVGATGTVLGSATIRRGGGLTANVVIEGVPLGRVDALGSFARDVEGSISGLAHVTGNLDDFLPDSGFVVRAGLDVAGTRVRHVAVAASHLEVTMTNRMPRQLRVYGRTQCGGLVGSPFDKQAFLADTSSHGEWTVNGTLLGGAIALRDVVVTRARSPRMTGRASMRGLDLGVFARIMTSGHADESSTTAPAPIGGQLWGELIVDDGWLDVPSKSRARLFLGPTVVSRGGQKLTLQPPRAPLVLADDALTMPPLEVTLETAEGLRGGFEFTGGATRLTSNPILSVDARLQPLDLGILGHLVPKLDRVNGHVEGSVHISGTASAPELAGELHAIGDDIEVRSLPSAITDVRIDVRATASQVAASGTGRFAGGTIAFHGAVPLQGFEIGPLESRVAVRGVRLKPAEGVSTSVDADLQVSYDPKAQGGQTATLPHVTGDVTLGLLSYTRPITFNLDLASARAKRTVVDAYDPALDFVVFDVQLRSRVPIVIKNNLIEVQLAVDSGALEVTGTNQRLGLRGVLRALAGGRFHFQGNEFDVQQALIRFNDPTRIDPNVDITAITEYRRYTDTSAGTAAGAGTSGGPAAASANSTRGGSLWRITMHAYGDADNVRIELTSEPALAQDDIVLLLAIGMTRAELDQLQASGTSGIALNVIGTATGADRVVKQAIPIIDDFRFGSAYSTVTGKTEPQLTVGKRLTNDLRASVQAGLSEDRELRANIEWRLNNRLSLQGSYDNINDVSSSALGNLGVDLRWRLDFE
jgi:translocation and assembly module TamB